MPNATALVVAAGSGKRFASSVSKILLPLSGCPLFLWCLKTLNDSPLIDRIYLAVKKSDIELFEASLVDHPIPKLSLPLIPGGSTRSGSVRNLLDAARDDAPQTVLIHDAARPFISLDMIADVIEAAQQHDSATIAVAATDTMKRQGENGLLCQAVPREGLWCIQTPQAFDYARLLDSYAQWPDGDATPTDETSVMERAGVPSVPVQGSRDNIKITCPEDIHLAQAILALRSEA
jgi:2-C-methyl-D-erythritol 4-phosphate cytidylyltransferase